MASGCGAKRAFYSTRYVPDASGRLTPFKPARCPRADDNDSVCFVVVKQWCTRKCGPGHALLVCLCYAHGSFRIYPLGWRPFSRRGLAHGHDSHLAAVRAAAAGKHWPELAQHGQTTRRTQRRWTAMWSRLVGVDPSGDDSARLRAALTLGIDTVTLQDGANRIRAGPTSKGGRARVIMDILHHLHPVGLLYRALRRGFECREWGKPIFEVRGEAPHFNITKS
jgi:hypothetical protein